MKILKKDINNKNTLVQKKKLRTNFVAPLFALITERICCGIVSTTLCNVTTFITIRSCIYFWPRFCIDDRRVKTFLRFFPAHPKEF